MAIRYLDEAPAKSRIRYLDEEPRETVTPEIVSPYKGQDFISSGLTGLSAGRGFNAAKRGASWEDVPGVAAKAASGFYGNTLENISEKPIKTAMGGGFTLAGAQGLSPEQRQLPYPRPVTKEGKKLGEEVNAFGNASGSAALVSEIPKIYKNARSFVDYARKVNPSKLYTEAEDMLINILKPRIGELNAASARGQESPESLRRTLPYIKPSKDYGELSKNLSEAKFKTAAARNKLLRNDNFSLGDEFLTPLKEHIMELRRRPQTEDVRSELETAMGVYGDYQDWAKRGGLSRIKGQIEKTKLQRETEPLLKKVSKGEAIDRNPNIVKAKDRVRRGLKDAVHADDPEIINRDLDYAALKQTSAMAANQKNLARKAPRQNFIERTPIVKQVFQALARNKPYSIQIATEALNQEPTLAKQTKKIADLYERARTLEAGAPPGVPGGARIEFSPQIEYSPTSPAKRSLSNKSLTTSQRTLEADIPRQLEGPPARRLLGVSTKHGEGFEIKPPLSEDERKLLEHQAFLKEILENPKIEIPFYGPRKNPASRDYSGNIIEQEITSALEAALKRRGLKEV